MSRDRCPAVLGLCGLLALPAFSPAQPDAKPADLPVTRIVLYSSGVGYYQRDGQVTDTARIDLQFPESAVNDLLKSLTLQDTGGGRVSAVSYDNRNPVERTLKSFAIDLTSNPSIGQLLGQVRGERVELTAATSGTMTGLIVGVEKTHQPTDKGGAIEVEQLNLLTADGLQGVPLAGVKRIRFVKPELEQEFRKALEVLAAGRDQGKKTVSLQFTGNGRRPVRVGYLMESPMWKTSYRLALDAEGKTLLQGWAMVENTTDEDWNHVRLGLVSGRPISFKMDLYDPLFVPRPTVEPEIFASLRPPTYQGDMADKSRVILRGAANQAARRQQAEQFMYERANTPKPGDSTAKSDLQIANGSFQYAIPPFGGLPNVPNRAVDLQAGVTSAAAGINLGDAFQYLIEDPVTLPRQKSALLPIVNQPVEAKRVSIYNEAVLPKHPLLGARFTNATDLHLMQGPITVFDGPNYAGDARLPDLRPKESRLLSYAIDLGTEVEAVAEQAPATLLTVKVARGVLESSSRQRMTRTYRIVNRSADTRTVLVEHPYRPDWSLVKPEKSAERSRDVYRFEVAAEANKPGVLEVVEEQTTTSTVRLTDGGDDVLQFFQKATATSAPVKEALAKALELRGRLAETRREMEREQAALKTAEQDQARQRANVERLPQNSEPYARFVKKMGDLETEIEKRRAKLTQLEETAEQQRREFEAFVMGLKVE